MAVAASAAMSVTVCLSSHPLCVAMAAAFSSAAMATAVAMAAPFQAATLGIVFVLSYKNEFLQS